MKKAYDSIVLPVNKIGGLFGRVVHEGAAALVES